MKNLIKTFSFIFLFSINNTDAQNVGVSDVIFTPQGMLHVYKSTAGPSSLFQVSNVTSGSTATDGLLFDFDASFNITFNNRENTYLQFNTNATQRMRILSTGQVGINKTPGTTFFLDVTNASTTADDGAIWGSVTGNAKTYGLLGTTTSTTSDGSGVRGYASGATGATNGVWGEAASSTGSGVYGLATHANGDGIYGYNNAVAGGGGGSGVYGYSSQALGAGVYGDGGTNSAGVFGVSSKKHVWNSAVYGENDNNTSGTSWAYDQVTCGISGRATGTAIYATGVYGYNNNSAVNDNAAVFAQDGQGYIAGLTFTFTPGATQRTLGVYGRGTGGADDRAIQGEWSTVANNPWGFIGEATTGVYGDAGTVASGYGVRGYSGAASGYGGYFSCVGNGLYATTSTPASYWGFIVGAGSALASGQTWSTSDRRFKKDISPLGDGTLEKIMKLNPCEYYLDAIKYPIFQGNKDKQFGLLAQELEMVFPDLVNNKKYMPDPIVDPNGEEIPPMVKGYYAVDYTSLIPILIKGMQEQQQIIAKLQNEKIYNEGISSLTNGRKRINFETSFIELIGINIPIVSITPMGQCNGIYISNIDTKGFEVIELNNGKSNITFSYIIIGKNNNLENKIVVPVPIVEKNLNESEIIYDNDFITNSKSNFSLHKSK